MKSSGQKIKIPNYSFSSDSHMDGVYGIKSKLGTARESTESKQGNLTVSLRRNF